MSKVNIEMIHDLVCSWCAIGFRHLTGAAEALGIELEISYLPHQLNPNMKAEGMDIREYFKRTHGWSDEKHNSYREQLVVAAETAGVKLDFRYRTRYFNTHLAHRLLAEAHAEDPAGELARNLHEILLQAYHAYGLNISELGVLTELAGRAGVSSRASERALDSNQSSAAYDQAVARRSEFITPSVPAWVVNGSELIIGSRTRAFFEDYLQNLIDIQSERRAI